MVGLYVHGSPGLSIDYISDWFTLMNKDKFAGKVYLELTFWSNVCGRPEALLIVLMYHPFRNLPPRRSRSEKSQRITINMQAPAPSFQLAITQIHRQNLILVKLQMFYLGI